MNLSAHLLTLMHRQGSIIRAKVYDAFQDYIDRAYKLLEGNDGRSDSERVHVGSASDMEAYLLALVARDGVDVDTDLFSAGIDSLQAGRIRSSIQRVPQTFTIGLEHH